MSDQAQAQAKKPAFDPIPVKRGETELIFSEQEKKRGKSSGEVYPGVGVKDLSSTLLVSFFGDENVRDILGQKLNVICQTVFADLIEETDKDGNVIGKKAFDTELRTKFADLIKELSTGTGEKMSELEDRRDGYVAEMTALYAPMQELASKGDMAGLQLIAEKAGQLTKKIHDVGAVIAAKSRKKKKDDDETPVATATA